MVMAARQPCGHHAGIEGWPMQAERALHVELRTCPEKACQKPRRNAVFAVTGLSLHGDANVP